MTEPQIQTIILLMILAAQLVHLLQTLIFNRRVKSTYTRYSYWEYDQFKENRKQIATLEPRIVDSINAVLRRITEVKTRLADEERDDQRQKAQERYRKHHGKA